MYKKSCQWQLKNYCSFASVDLEAVGFFTVAVLAAGALVEGFFTATFFTSSDVSSLAGFAYDFVTTIGAATFLFREFP